MNKGHYILNDKKEIVPVSLIEWGKWLQTNQKERIVQQDTFPNGVWVSTVFLGIDHNFEDTGEPLLFETMVFGLQEEVMERYSNYKDALAGHMKMLEQYTPKEEVKDEPA